MPAKRPLVVAMTDGLFAAEGLAVITNMTAGSPEAIARVASGASEFAIVDLNALIRFRSRSSAPVKAVFVLFNKAPYAIVARKSRGIHVLSDLEGKTLGVADGDLSAGLWPALARQNGIHLDHVKQSPISAAVREPMLSAGQVDAVTGFSFLSAVNLRDRGVPADDLAVLRFADYGCDGLRLCADRQSRLRRETARRRERFCAGADCRHQPRPSATRAMRSTRSSPGWRKARAIWS